MADETQEAQEAQDYDPLYQGVGALAGTERSAMEIPLKISERMPIRRKLEIRIASKEKELTELKDALEALNKNPEYEKLHDTLARVARFL